MNEKDTLVSTTALLEGIARVEGEIEAQRRLRADSDPFFKHTRWVVEEWRAALREAEQEYRPTAQTAALTGWSEETLRRHAKALHEGGGAPKEWLGMIVRKAGGDYTFLLSSVPVKRSVAA